MRDDLVSIIVPIYNVELYILRCLKSIQNQTYSNIEVIMVDDGSNDNSANIARCFEKDSRFKLYSKENSGVAEARNFGLKYVTGTFLIFVDSDDFISNNYVELLINEFDCETDIIITDYVIYSQDQKKAYRHFGNVENREYSSTNDKKELLNELLVPGSFVMPVWKNVYRTEFITSNHLLFISEREVYAEDKLFNMIAYWKARKIKITNYKIYFHTIIGNSLSHGYKENYYSMCKEMHNRLSNFFLEIGELDLGREEQLHLADSVASAIYIMTKCKKKQAFKNIKMILGDEFTKSILRNKNQKCYLKRYSIILSIAKIHSVVLLFVFICLIHKAEPLYRKKQKNQEFLIGNTMKEIINC